MWDLYKAEIKTLKQCVKLTQSISKETRKMYETCSKLMIKTLEQCMKLHQN